MKDFHDLWMIGQTVTFEFAAVADAIQQTFEGRRTSCRNNGPPTSAILLSWRENPSGSPYGRVTGSKRHRLYAFKASINYAPSCNLCWPVRTLRHGLPEAPGPKRRLPRDFLVPDKTVRHRPQCQRSPLRRPPCAGSPRTRSRSPRPCSQRLRGFVRSSKVMSSKSYDDDVDLPSLGFPFSQMNPAGSAYANCAKVDQRDNKPVRSHSGLTRHSTLQNTINALNELSRPRSTD